MSFLDNVPEENAFVLSNGARIMNLEELLVVIKGSDDSLFYDHVTPERNDFANWIKFVIHHDNLYVSIFGVKNKQDFLKILEDEINYIKNPKLRETAKFFSKDYDPKMNDILKNPNSNIVSPSIIAPNTVLGAATQNPATDNVQTGTVQNTSKNRAPVSPIASPKSAAVLNVNNPVDSNSVDDAHSSVTGATNNISLPSASIIDEIPEFEQVLSMLISEINTEIFSWNE